jgi:hypothetical protein
VYRQHSIVRLKVVKDYPDVTSHPAYLYDCFRNLKKILMRLNQSKPGNFVPTFGEGKTEKVATIRSGYSLKIQPLVEYLHEEQSKVLRVSSTIVNSQDQRRSLHQANVRFGIPEVHHTALPVVSQYPITRAVRYGTAKSIQSIPGSSR